MHKRKAMIKQRFAGFIAVLLLGLTSCDQNMIFDESQGIENNLWLADDIKTYAFDVTDTLSPINMFVNMRTTVDYPYSNIYVFLYSEFPNGTTDKDTLEFVLAENDGKWRGENSGTVVEFSGLIASGVRFSTPGTYSFQLQHAMREQELPEVIDIGIRVEKMEQE